MNPSGMRACEISVQFSPNETWVKAVSIAAEGASVVERTESAEPLGRSPGGYPGQNQGLARLSAVEGSCETPTMHFERIKHNLVVPD